MWAGETGYRGGAGDMRGAYVARQGEGVTPRGYGFGGTVR